MLFTLIPCVVVGGYRLFLIVDRLVLLRLRERSRLDWLLSYYD